MQRLYLMPLVGVGTKTDPLRPKYADSILTPSGTGFASMTYGARPVTLMAADTSDIVHGQLTANADVYAFPDGFQAGVQTVGNQGATLTSIFEGTFGIPAQWIQPQDTYLSVAHVIGGMFQFLQRMMGIMGTATDPFTGATLNTQVRNLPQEVEDAFWAAGQSFGWNMSGITDQTTIRNALKYMSDQWGAAPLYLGGFLF